MIIFPRHINLKYIDGSWCSRCMIYCCAMMLINQTSFGQMTAGITNIRDSSFSNYSAFQKSKKTNPETTIVPLQKFPDISENYDVVYCRQGKRALSTDIFQPKKKQAGRTAIIIIHGGGWRSGNRTQHHALAQKLASLGYVCFTPEYRLSTEALFPAAVYDLKAMIRYVRSESKRYGIDTSKLVTLGFSAGGQLAALLGTTGNMPLFEGQHCSENRSSAVNAIVDIDGTLSFVHPESGEGDDSKKPSAATLWFGYSKKENFSLWEQASPLTHVNGGTPPVLFINSSVDRMHAGRDQFIDTLNAHHIYSEVHRFENSPHSFCLFNPWFEPTVNFIDAFLKKIFP
ncbi:MAG: esterase [Ferruginibacter sp.]|nr:esterase [Ferruginibacter sp.]